MAAWWGLLCTEPDQLLQYPACMVAIDILQFLLNKTLAIATVGRYLIYNLAIGDEQ
jgi:hypothetical protein